MAAHLRSMVRLATAILLGSALGGVALATEVRAQAQPADQITVAFDVSIAPSFLEPAETPGIGTPFVFLYALHDALIKPMPGNNMAPCLAESWKESPDGLTYEFKLREGLRFHNGDPFTAEDVKFSFHRYRGTAAKLLHERVKAVEIIDPHRVRFVLQAPWPDFLAFYATPATGAAWACPDSTGTELTASRVEAGKPVLTAPARWDGTGSSWARARLVASRGPRGNHRVSGISSRPEGVT